MTINRRQFLAEGTLTALGLAVLGRTAGAQDKPSLKVYKSPSCGCCSKWIDHMRANGFDVTVEDMDDVSPIKARYKVAQPLESCHTAIVDGYVIEGHVPAADVKRLLKERPKVVGLTIPGMPQSAPGMDVTPHQPYEVLAFDVRGKTTVYAKY